MKKVVLGVVCSLTVFFGIFGLLYLRRQNINLINNSQTSMSNTIVTPVGDNSDSKNSSINQSVKFECDALPRLTFSFPVFPKWKYLGVKIGQPGYCSFGLELPADAKVSLDSPKVVNILVYKTAEPFSMVGQVKKQATNQHNITYILYDNNELRFKAPDGETVIIKIVDIYHTGGVRTGTIGLPVPAKENGFDYEEFWKVVLESLDYRK